MSLSHTASVSDRRPLAKRFRTAKTIKLLVALAASSDAPNEAPGFRNSAFKLGSPSHGHPAVAVLSLRPGY